MDYARALAEHPRWTWHIGMVAERGARVYDVGKGFAGYEVPDINHPATKGWLLHMLREATGDRYAFASDAVRGGGQWEAFAEGLAASRGQHWQATEGEALAAALLAVWGLPKADDLGTDADRKPVTF